MAGRRLPITRGGLDWGGLPLRAKVSLAVLLVANGAAVCGVLFWNWSQFQIMLSYWLELVVIGCYSLLKMRLCRRTGDLGGLRNYLSNGVSAYDSLVRAGIDPGVMGERLRSKVMALFAGHYFVFVFVYLIFILFFALGFGGNGAAFDYALLSGAIVMAVSLLVSHGLSFYINYVKGGEAERAELSGLFVKPYERIIPMHLAIIASGFVGLPAILLIVFKTAADAYSHLKEREGLA